MDDVELDNERHRREEQERRAKRKAHRSSKSKSESQTEKERIRKEHAQRILGQQQHSKSSSSRSSKKSPSSKSPSSSNSSIFQSLFHQRAQGFLINFNFRNAPPRPPVGPMFVGLGLEGELTDKWTRYKPRNAVEKQYVWKLHSGNELYSVPLAVSAMDFEGCYVDPEKVAASGAEGNNNGEEGESGQKKSGAATSSHVIPPLHPDDEALLNWKGSMGDTAAEQLQQKRDRARAAARLAIAQGYGSLSAAALATPSLTQGSSGSTPSSSSKLGSKVMKLKKKSHLHSRILDEQTPHFMKKTTYLTNTATSVHQFTSLAHTQEKRAREVDRALAETSERYKKEEMVERGFVEANSWDVRPVVGGGNDAAANSGKKRRVHPSKKGVYPVWDLPLLPDVPTWGHTYAHVVLDHPPKSVGNSSSASSTTPKKGGANQNIVSAQQLQQAIVADVSKQTSNSRMACTVWVPDAADVSDTESSPKEDEEQPPTKKQKKESSEAYHAVQRYDLDVLPLRDPSGPQVHYVLSVDPSKNYVGYHPVGSRVQLSTGRPIVQSGSVGRYGPKTDEVVTTNESLIFRRDMEVEERQEMEKRMAEVDVDMAEKYGLVADEEDGGKGAEEEMEKDAF